MIRLSSRLVLGAVLGAACALVACDENTTPAGPDAAATAAASAKEAAPAAFDATARKAELQGKWRVGSPDKPRYELEIDGDAAKLVDHRMSPVKTIEGKLLLPSATALSIKLEDGTTYHYRLADHSGGLHFGMGIAEVLPDPETFTMELGMFEEKLVRTKGDCTWSKNFGEKTEKKVTCSVVEEGGKKLLRYQVPDGDDLRDRELTLVGGFALSDELVDGKLEPAG